MNERLCLKLAGRINALLVRDLGQGIDTHRMLAEPLYARDVLLVCEALRAGELPNLALRFRHALTDTGEGRPDREGPRSGFSASRFVNSFFGLSSGSGEAAAFGRGWFSRSSGDAGKP